MCINIFIDVYVNTNLYIYSYIEIFYEFTYTHILYTDIISHNIFIHAYLRILYTEKDIH